ncbi:hypothetical protein LZL87_012980 [Fusarium oxysporum]|nr:hypothetical protein LZL87_012980 [Fusarium oxysporum]
MKFSLVLLSLAAAAHAVPGVMASRNALKAQALVDQVIRERENALKAQAPKGQAIQDQENALKDQGQKGQAISIEFQRFRFPQ